MNPEIHISGVRLASCGQRVVIVNPSNVYGAHLDDEVFVGPFCEIQEGVHIGARTRVQSHSFICSFVKIGSDCFIGHAVAFVNDLLRDGPARGDRSKYVETFIGDRVSIGSNATILPVSICSDVVIGAGSVVSRPISEAGTYLGNPARRVNR